MATQDERSLKVLILEDDEDTKDLFTFILESIGYIVKATSQAIEALKILEEFTPDIVISDIGLPEVDGYTFVSQMKEVEILKHKKIPAIAVTGFASMADRIRALEAGFELHIPKPIDPDALIASVEQVVKA